MSDLTKWDGNHLERFNVILADVASAGIKNPKVWERKCSAPALAEFLANRVGNRAKMRESARLAFRLYLDGELSDYKETSGKSVSAEKVLALMIGRDLNNGQSAPPVGNKKDGEFPWYSAYQVAQVTMFRGMDKALASTGGRIRPYGSTRRADPSKRVSVAATAEKIHDQDEVAARIEEYAMSRRPRPLPVAQESPLKALHATVKETAKQRKARKQRERRAAVKASKSSK